ncbi:monooxygenase [Aspergillus ellipticus CBS 707.79]|uniref:Monooxygenase n=1 Tax=Aspergillus ellipticus CBS 707.79 TaxID=1448320 RepID=A0A319D768_9EURO|nr:monooxygenase [Aspergillus ellipticus CBS 707.79]
MSALEDTSRPFVKVIVIGAGVSGLAMGCQLRRQLKCDDFVIYDRAAEAGGTWAANHYPGCGVDIPAVFYSLSFAPNPDFSKLFPKQPEILNYLHQVIEKNDLARHFVGNVQWETAAWNEATSTWLVTLRDMHSNRVFEHECKVLISAVGGLSVPNEFRMKGMESFTGDIVHTARWNKDLSLKGKHVVVIGNGSSASQLVPSIVDEAKTVTQFIRTPQHYVPSQNRLIGPNMRTLFRYVPGLLWLFRMLIFLYLETAGAQFNRTAEGAAMRAAAMERCKQYIQENAPEEYWPLLVPSYDFGCKRRVFDSENYIASLQCKNVFLTDDPITALESDCVVTRSGKRLPADVIVLATGFALTQFDVPLQGLNGQTRASHWKQTGSKSAFKTVAMAGFPNFFYILGPHAGRGHTSTILTIENFIHLILRAIKPVLSGRAESVEISDASDRKFHTDILVALEKTVFSGGCSSWYIDSQTGRNWFIYPWSSFGMWYSTHVEGMEDWVYRTEEKYWIVRLGARLCLSGFDRR